MYDLKDVLKCFNEATWREISSCKLPKEFIFDYKDKICWEEVDHNKLNLNLEEVEECKQYIDWHNFSLFIKDKEVMIKYFDLIDFDSNSLEIERPFKFYYGLKDFISPEQFKHLFTKIHYYSIGLSDLINHYDLVKDKFDTLYIKFKKSELNPLKLKNKMAQLDPKTHSKILCYFLLSNKEELSESVLEDLIIPTLDLSDFFSNLMYYTEENKNLSNFIKILYNKGKLNLTDCKLSTAPINYVMNSDLNNYIKSKFIEYYLLNIMNSKENRFCDFTISFDVAVILKDLLKGYTKSMSKEPFCFTNEEVLKWIELNNHTS